MPAQSRPHRRTLLADSPRGSCPARFVVPRGANMPSTGDSAGPARTSGIRTVSPACTGATPHARQRPFSGALRMRRRRDRRPSRNRDASAGFLDSPARGTYQARVARGRRELLAAAPTPLLRCSPLEFVEEPIVLVHTASHGSPGRARACVNSPVSSIAGYAKGAQWCPAGHRPVSGAPTVSTYRCREGPVAALRHGA